MNPTHCGLSASSSWEEPEPQQSIMELVGIDGFRPCSMQASNRLGIEARELGKHPPTKATAG